MKIASLYFYFVTGRKFYSGLKSTFKFIENARNEFFYGQIVFIDRNIISSGETIQANIDFVRPELVQKYFINGGKFNFYEGAICLGEGVVIS